MLLLAELDARIAALFVVCAIGCATEDEPLGEGAARGGSAASGGTNGLDAGPAGSGAASGGIGPTGAVGNSGGIGKGGSVGDGAAGSAGAGGTAIGGGGSGGPGNADAGGDPNCHVDCFGGATCVHGVVSVSHFGACPCSTCPRLSDCIAYTFTCSGGCARDHSERPDPCVFPQDRSCYHDAMCAATDAGED